jgi:hypothetical protein
VRGAPSGLAVKIPVVIASVDPRLTRRSIRPRGVCGYRPRRRPATEQPAELDEYLREHPGIASALRLLEGLSDAALLKARDELGAEGWKLRQGLSDFDEREAGEISHLGAKGTGMSDIERERFETSPYRDFAMHQVLWMAARIEVGRRRERRDPLYLGPNRYGRVSKRFSRRWGHLRPSQINRHPRARRDIAHELYATAGCRGRAPRQATNTRTQGSRRGAPPRGPPSDDPDEADPHALARLAGGPIAHARRAR